MKTKRHAKILELISNSVISTQDELLNKLSESGYNVTQATVSRDIKELKLIKSLGDNGSYHYTVNVRDKDEVSYNFRSIFSEAVIGISYAGNIVCIKCHNGMANAACASFDALNRSEVVGSLAGDDTIFVLTRNEESSAGMAYDLRKLLKR